MVFIRLKKYHLFLVCWIFLSWKGVIYFSFLSFIYVFIYGCVGSSFLCEGFLQLWQAGATLPRGARASHYRGLSCCGAQAPDAQAQQLWLTGLVTPRHVGSSQTRAGTRVPCIGRQILNHCATREAPKRCYILSNAFSESIEMIMWTLSFILLIWSIILNDFHMLN